MKLLMFLSVMAMLTLPVPAPAAAFHDCHELAQFAEISANYRDQGVAKQMYQDRLKTWAEANPQSVTYGETMEVVKFIDFVYESTGRDPEELAQYVYDHCSSGQPYECSLPDGCAEDK